LARPNRFGPCDFHEGNHAVVFPDVRLIGSEIGNVDNLFGVGEAVKRESWIFAQVDCRITSPRLDVTLVTAVDRYGAKDRSFAQEQIAERGFTDACCIRQHGIEDWFKLPRRT
jgi:hypothetical protein